MSEVRALLATLRERGIELTPVGEDLRYRAPSGALTDELREGLRRHKAELLAILGEKGGGPSLSLPGFDPDPRLAAALRDPARQRLARWAVDHGTPALRFRPWASVVGTAPGWMTFLATAPDDDIAAAMEAAGLSTEAGRE